MYCCLVINNLYTIINSPSTDSRTPRTEKTASSVRPPTSFVPSKNTPRRASISGTDFSSCPRFSTRRPHLKRRPRVFYSESGRPFSTKKCRRSSTNTGTFCSTSVTKARLLYLLLYPRRLRQTPPPLSSSSSRWTVNSRTWDKTSA